MPGLISLGNIPYRARAAEASERAKWPTRAMALDAATIRIVDAPGCYRGVPDVWGYVLTMDAARAISELRCSMPGGPAHRRAAYEEGYPSSDALGMYLEAIARGVSQAEALAAYEASIED